MTGRPLSLVTDEAGPLARVTTRLRGRRNDIHEPALEHQIAVAAQPTRFNVAAVLSPHGGTGKTTLTLLLANALARHGNVRTVVVDATPDYGTLTATGAVAADSATTIGDLLDAAPGLLNPAELRPYVTQLAGGAHLLCGGPDDTALSPDRVAELLGYLAAFYELALVDCATGIASDLAQHAIARADHTVLVTTPQLARSSAALQSLGELERRSPIVALNRAQDHANALEHISGQFSGDDDTESCVVAIPEDPELVGAVDVDRFDLDALARTTRCQVKQLAALVAGRLR